MALRFIGGKERYGTSVSFCKSTKLGKGLISAPSSGKCNDRQIGYKSNAQKK